MLTCAFGVCSSASLPVHGHPGTVLLSVPSRSSHFPVHEANEPTVVSAHADRSLHMFDEITTA